jgi:hypothetical protein
MLSKYIYILIKERYVHTRTTERLSTMDTASTGSSY